MSKNPIPESTVNEIWKRAKNVCEAVWDNNQRCRKGFYAESLAEKRFAIHHKKFRSRQGTNDKINLVLLCPDCHYKVHHYKGDWTARYRTKANKPEGTNEMD